MLNINTTVCDLCGTCIGVCPESALLLNQTLSVISENCTDCAVCVSICPVAALKITGE